MNTHSIIIYRNPLEQQMWESLMSGNMFPVMVGALVFFISFLLLHKFVVVRFFSWSKRDTPTNISLGVSAFLGILTIWVMAFS